MILNKKKIILGSLGSLAVGVGAGLPIAATAQGPTKLTVLQKAKKNKTEIQKLYKIVSQLKKLGYANFAEISILKKDNKRLKIVEKRFNKFIILQTENFSRVSKLLGLLENVIGYTHAEFVKHMFEGKKSIKIQLETIQKSLENFKTSFTKRLASVSVRVGKNLRSSRDNKEEIESTWITALTFKDQRKMVDGFLEWKIDGIEMKISKKIAEMVAKNKILEKGLENAKTKIKSLQGFTITRLVAGVVKTNKMLRTQRKQETKITYNKNKINNVLAKLAEIVQEMKEIYKK